MNTITRQVQITAMTHEYNNPQWFRGRTALVTGASSGIGSEVAAALGSAGANVVINYRGNHVGAEAVKTRVEAGGGRAIVCQADVSRSADVHRMFEEAASVFGDRIDMLVNNAGNWMDKQPVIDCDESMWEQMFAVNVRSVFLCCQCAAKKMVGQGEGSIVNIGSLAGHTGGGGGTVPYAAAKAAVHTFTRGLARELGPSNVRVNAVAPGMIDTPMLEGRVARQSLETLKAMTPLGRLGSVSEVAPLVLLLLSPASAFITGEVIEVNGGLLMR
jgi:3-oxoacyl-[acyl-carrier protein] reductase